MKIKYMTKLNNPDSKIKAFFSVETKNFTINSCRLIEKDGKLFTGFPSREYVNKKGEKKYEALIWIHDTDILKAINDEALKIYHGKSQPSDEDIPF